VYSRTADLLIAEFAERARSSRDVNAAVKRQLIYTPRRMIGWSLCAGVNGAAQHQVKNRDVSLPPYGLVIIAHLFYFS
jgi:hypothetical protein